MLLVHDKLLKIATEINKPKNLREIILGVAKGFAKNNQCEIVLDDLRTKTKQEVANNSEIEILECVRTLIETHRLVPVVGAGIIKFRLKPQTDKFQIHQRKIQSAFFTNGIYNASWAIIKEERQELAKNEISLLGFQGEQLQQQKDKYKNCKFSRKSRRKKYWRKKEREEGQNNNKGDGI